MSPEHIYETLFEVLNHIHGFIFPNELELQWSILIVLYPFITGLVAGAFILASLERVFNIEEVKPTYRLSLLTALAFLIVAPLPLQAHLGHPERSWEIMVTPNPTSAMAMFGFVYVWYLMAVLLLEIWFDYRADIVAWSKTARGVKRIVYKTLTLGVDEVTPKSLELDEKIGRFITAVGIPSAFLLHGYVGFIFGSLKSNPWWSTPLMPIIFLCSAMVSGIAAVLLIYMAASRIRKIEIDMPCLDTIAKYLLTALILDFALECLEVIQKTYEAEEHFDILVLLVQGKLYISFLILQVILGALVPLAALAAPRVFEIRPRVRRWIYGVSAVLILVGIFAMRWNVVIGGQFFSKSLMGFTTYKLELVGREGLLVAIVVMLLPFPILAALIHFFPPWGAHPAAASQKSEPQQP